MKDQVAGAAAALSAEHQDRIARLLRADFRIGWCAVHFVFQRLEPRDNAMHAFETRSHPGAQADVCGLPENLHAQRKSLRGSHSNSPARRLGQKHATPLRPSNPSRASHADPPSPPISSWEPASIQFCRFILRPFPSAQELHKASDDAALQCRRSAAKQKMFLAERFKLPWRLRRNHVVMPMKIERSLSASATRPEDRQARRQAPLSNLPAQALAVQPNSLIRISSRFAQAIILPRWEFSWNGHKLREQGCHLAFACRRQARLRPPAPFRIV